MFNLRKKKFFNPLVGILLALIAASSVMAYLAWQPLSCQGTGTGTVTAVQLASISITPAGTVNIEQHSTQQFVATGTYNDGSQQNLSGSVGWFLSNNKASVSTAGLVTAGASKGTDNLSASLGGITSNTVIINITNHCDWGFGNPAAEVTGSSAQIANLQFTVVTSNGLASSTAYANDTFTATATLAVTDLGDTSITGFNISSPVYPVLGSGYSLSVNSVTLTSGNSTTLTITLTGTAPAAGPAIDFSGIKFTLTPSGS